MVNKRIKNKRTRRKKKICENCKYWGSPAQIGDPPAYVKNANCSNPKIEDVKITKAFIEDGISYYGYGGFAVLKFGPSFGCIHFTDVNEL